MTAPTPKVAPPAPEDDAATAALAATVALPVDVLRESIAKGLEAEAAKFAYPSYSDRCVRDKLLDVAKRVRSGEWG